MVGDRKELLLIQVQYVSNEDDTETAAVLFRIFNRLDAENGRRRRERTSTGVVYR